MNFPLKNITDFVPQRTPMLMVDSILSAKEASLTTSFIVQSDNIFIQNNFLSAPGLIENIAQTAAAARAGLEAVSANSKPKVGFIGSIKNLHIHSLPPVGSEIHTTIEIVNEVLNISVVIGKSYHKDVLLCECELKIVLTES